MRSLRIALALSLPFVGWHLHRKAIATVDVAIDAPRSVDNPLPKDRAGDFFGEDPREAAKTPKGRGLLLTSQLIDLAALGCFIGCPLLFASVFIRRHTPQPQQEPSCEASESPSP